MERSPASPTECFFDGACPGNQFGDKGPMRAAYVIDRREYEREVPDLETPRGRLRSNNIAEYHGLIFLLRQLHEETAATGQKGEYVIYGDSQLVIRQMTGRYRVKEEHLRVLHAEVKRLAAELNVRFEEIPRSRNKAGFLLEASARSKSR